MRQLLTSLGVLMVAATATTLGLKHDRPRFEDVAVAAGLRYTQMNSPTPEKYMPETMGGGAVIFDYNNDNLPDILFVNGGSFVDAHVAAEARHHLFRNTGGGRFEDVSATSGLKVSGYGMGACSADYDNDGWADLYVTAVGADRLYRNNKGAFVDVSASAGVGSDLWSASCAFGDIDNDGDVDLYVTRYVDFSVKNNKYCRLVENIRGYCHPNVYKGIADLLYRNDGDGTFTEIAKEAGTNRAGNGLGVVFGDYDNDGWTDIYVANDSTRNFLFHNLGNGTFEDAGLWAGVAVGADGKPLAGMGTDMADMDNDGLLDIFVTNLDGQTHTLYKNLGKGLFSDVTFPSGIGEASLPFVGFGATFLDYDNDGDLDIAVANGDVLDNVRLLRDNTSYEQVNLLLQNDGSGKFQSAGAVSGPGFAMKQPSRSLAAADLDNDGDLDLVVGNVGAPPNVLRNDGGNEQNSLIVRTIGSKSNRQGVGARLKLTAGGRVSTRFVKAGSSYLAQNDIRVHFGLGSADRADRLEIRWPSGTVDLLEATDANQIITVTEGKGITGRQPFTRK